MSDKVIIFDTTLRDGEQCPGASMDIEQKLEVARQLAAMKVDVIEAGFPISSEGDFQATKIIAETIKGPIIAALARAVEIDIKRAGEALANCPNRRIHTFIATSDIHLEFKLKKTREQVLEQAVKAVKLARTFTDDVEFSPEDATRSDLDYMSAVLEACIDAGATTLNIPDTVGYALPDEYGAMLAAIFAKVPNIRKAVVSAHCHNDLGLAVANSLAAVKAGARQVECTINGIGERAGNAAMEEIVMAIRVRKDVTNVHTDVVSREFYRASRLISDVTGFAVQPNKAIVGRNAFAHEAGIHQHGIIANTKTYEIMSPSDVGVERSEIYLGPHSGKHGFEAKLKELGYNLTAEQLEKAYQRFKVVVGKKKQMSDAEIESLVGDEVYQAQEQFSIDYMHVVSGGTTVPTATIGIRKGGEVIQRAEIGVGTVDAVFKTINSILNVPHTLVDYTVKSITGGTEALGEVTVRIRDKNSAIFIGRGASPDVIEASAKAYLQAINKLLTLARPAPGV